ncbi:MAG: hypothetical protein AAF481_12250 [Acidobacteriota bacterium]
MTRGADSMDGPWVSESTHGKALTSESREPVTSVAADFVDLDGGKTRVTLVQDRLNPEFVEYVKAGWSAACGRLDRLLMADAS